MFALSEDTPVRLDAGPTVAPTVSPVIARRNRPQPAAPIPRKSGHQKRAAPTPEKTVGPAEPTPDSPKLALTDKIIQQAVRDTLADTPDAVGLTNHDIDTLRATRYESFADAFTEARVPDCLHADGLKRAPPILVGGFLALPFIVIAKIRGKCI